jgi:uncharacterized protein (TIGR00251 family)
MLTEFIKQFAEKGEIYLRIKARPGAAATEVRGVMAGEEGETLKIDVAAPPENGKANQELVKFLADWFAVAKDKIKIISGAGDKVKLVKIKK